MVVTGGGASVPVSDAPFARAWEKSKKVAGGSLAVPLAGLCVRACLLIACCSSLALLLLVWRLCVC